MSVPFKNVIFGPFSLIISEVIFGGPYSSLCSDTLHPYSSGCFLNGGRHTTGKCGLASSQQNGNLRTSKESNLSESFYADVDDTKKSSITVNIYVF